MACSLHVQSFELDRWVVKSVHTRNKPFQSIKWRVRNFFHSPTYRDALFGRQYYWEQHIGPFLRKIPIVLLLLGFILILLLVLYCHCCSKYQDYWAVFSLLLVLYCYCTLPNLLYKWIKSEDGIKKY